MIALVQLTRWVRLTVAVTISNAVACEGGGASRTQDAGPAMPLPSCDPNAPFVVTLRNDAINSDAADSAPYLTPDGLALYFASDRPGSAGAFDLYVAKRKRAADPFSSPTALDEINTSSNEDTPFVTADGLTLYFSSNRPGSIGGIDLYVAMRVSVTALFGAPRNLSELNRAVPARQFSPHLSADGHTLYFGSDRTGNIHMYRAEWGSNGAFGTPEPVVPVSSQWEDASPWLSQDSLTLYFASSRPDGVSWNLWVAQRTGATDPFANPEELMGVGSADYQGEPALSADACTLFFSSNRPGSRGETDIWEAYRPVVR
jgi:Tol biopolymer transport system component